MKMEISKPKWPGISWEKVVDRADILKDALAVLDKIIDAGHEAYIVGGAVRDLLINKKIGDIDITTNCPMPILDQLFNTYEIGQSKKFGIVVVIEQGNSYEIAQFRQDLEYKDGRKPSSVKIVNSLKEDVIRRDFTINALALTKRGRLIDYVDGISDLRAGVIKAVGNPYDRFSDDKLRMLRAARFAAALNFTIEKNTRKAIRRLFRSINDVSKDRIRLELVKAAKGSGAQFAKFILLLDDLKLLAQILPEVSTLKYYTHSLIHHPEGRTVFKHVIKCLEISDADYLSKLSILFHDVGKSVTLQEIEGRMKYYNHARAGADLTKEICKRLKFSLHATETMVFAVANHMKWNHILEMKPSKIARLVSSPYFNVLVEVARADEFSRGETFKHRGKFKEELAKAKGIKERWEARIINNRLKLVDGNKIMKLTGLKPGPELGQLKNRIEELIIDNNLNPNDEDIINTLIKETCGGEKDENKSR